MTRREGSILLVIVVVQAMVVFLVFTPQPHTGGDNAGYVSLAHSLLERGAYLELWNPSEPPHTKYPPVFPAVLAGTILLGAKGWPGLKLVSAMATILAVAFTFLWARRREGPWAGATVALLFGISSAVVYYSQWILSDPLFLAFTMGCMWAFEMARPGEGTGSRRGGGREAPWWLTVGMGMVILAYFTRSAGLPLAVAVALWFGLRRRWKLLLAFAGVLGIPAFLWWLRGRVAGGGAYVSEFWLVDPYRPFLGNVGPAGLLTRVADNLGAYLGRIIPSGIVGAEGGFLVPLSIGLTSLGILGWVLTVRRHRGVPELFAPLYFALILLWPTPWSGDRFALPLFPLLFLYSATALRWLTGSWRREARWILAGAAVACLAVPAVQNWSRISRSARACVAATRAGASERCLSQPVEEYFRLAAWSGEDLPDGAVVVTRKPRIFYVMSGVQAESVPLTPDPEAFLQQVREGGSRYLTVDYLDNISRIYVYPVLAERPEAFCRLVETGGSQGFVTAIVGVRMPRAVEEGLSLADPCPGDMVRAEPRGRPAPGPWQIPLLVWGAGSGT